MVCSEHFSMDSFQRAYHIKEVSCRLKLAAVPTVWKAKSKLSEDKFTPRQRHKVSKFLFISSYCASLLMVRRRNDCTFLL